MSTIAIIPARQGSKGIPRKNLRILGGTPLIVHTIRAALGARAIDRTIVSTDSPEIATIASAAGAEVPFLRPAEISDDDTPTISAVLHAVEHLELSGVGVERVVTLQPTSPFRTGAHIDQAVALLERHHGDSAVSAQVTNLPASVVGSVDGPYFRPLYRGEDVRRQTSPRVWRIDGAIYVTTGGVLATGRLLGDRIVLLPTDEPVSIDIDTPADLRRARRLFRGRPR
jgi:CMP-N,N'-diacetyllegionaminic acid synthase